MSLTALVWVSFDEGANTDSLWENHWDCDGLQVSADTMIVEMGGAIFYFGQMDLSILSL